MKNKIRLGVNIDHVATVRNARGEDYPSPLKAALLSQKYGADSVTIHLREDRRHIKDKDLKIIRSKLNIPLNLENLQSAPLTLPIFFALACLIHFSFSIAPLPTNPTYI